MGRASVNKRTREDSDLWEQEQPTLKELYMPILDIVLVLSRARAADGLV